jgi:parvulin-like peptidyl-prolyl isomerase
MAQIRVSFSTALFAMSFVICLLVALLFVDRSRQENEEAAAAGAKTTTALGPVQNRESTLLNTTAMASTAFEKPTSASTNQPAPEAPKLVLNPATDAAAAAATGTQGSAGVAGATAGAPPTADLPVDPRLAQSIVPVTAAATPQLSAGELAKLSPEVLARQLQGRIRLPNSMAAAAPPMAVPQGVAMATVTPAPRFTPMRQAAATPLPIITNAQGAEGAMKQLGYGGRGTAGLSAGQGNPGLPFSQPGVVSTDKLRSVLAQNAGLDPNTLLPVDTAAASPTPEMPLTNSAGGWQPTQANAPDTLPPTPTPNTSIVIRGGQRQGSATPQTNTASVISPNGVSNPAAAANASVASASSSLPPAPATGVDPVAGVLTNDPAIPSPTPNYGAGFGNAPATAAMGSGGKWNLPPPPTLPGAAVRPEESKPAGSPNPSKVTLLPIDDPGAKPLSSDAAKSGPSSDAAVSNVKSTVGDLPLDVAARTGMLDNAVAATVNDRTLTGAEAARRAEALAAMDGRTLDADSKRMLTRTAAETWADMVSLAEEAKRQAVTVTDDEAKSLLAANPTLKADEWQAAMKKAGFTEAEIQADMRDIAMGEKLVQNLLAKNYDDSKLRAIYDQDPAKFQPSRRFHVQEIFKARPADAAAARNVEAEMSKLQRQASSGSDFGLLAMQAGEGPSKQKGGDLGWIDDKSRISEQMAQALLPLKPGQVSNVVTDARGYHVYKLIDLQEPKGGFDGARQLVQQGLHNGVYRSVLEMAESHNKIDLAHRQKSSRAVAGKPAKTGNDTDDLLSKVFAERKAERDRKREDRDKDRVASGENGRVRVRSSRKDRDTEPPVAKASVSMGQGSAGLAASTASAPVADSQSHDVAPADAPPGFGTTSAQAGANNLSTPQPATASAGSGGLRNSFTNLLSKLHRPPPNIQQ